MARGFNGTTDFIDVGGGANLSALYTAAVTVSCWINISSYANVYSGIVTFDTAGGITTGHDFYFKSTGKLAVYVTAFGNLSYDGTGSSTLNPNTWYHLAYSYDSVGGLVSYVNGSVDATVAANGALDLSTTSPVAMIGNQHFSGRNIGASLSDVAQWNVALTAGEIGALARGMRPNFIRSASLSGYWPLDGVNSPEPDLSGFKNNGVLTGTINVSGPPVALFTRRQPTIISPVGVFVYARPDADNIDGSWTNETGGTTLFSSIDETTFDDADYIISSNNPSSDLCKISLSDPAGSVSEPATVRYRYCKRGEASFQIDLQVTLLQGVTTIAQWTHTNIGTSFITAEQTLTSLQFNAISDFTDLYIQFSANKV